MNHPRYNNIIWDYEKQKWVFRDRKSPKRYYCNARGCTHATDLSGRKPPYTPRRYCARCRKRLSRANNGLRSTFNDLKHSATRRKIPFDIHYGAFLLFAIENDLYTKTEVSKTSFSIDRRDDSLGYTIDNIQVLSMGANSSKEHKRRFTSKWQDIMSPDPQPESDEDPF